MEDRDVLATAGRPPLGEQAVAVLVHRREHRANLVGMGRGESLDELARTVLGAILDDHDLVAEVGHLADDALQRLLDPLFVVVGRQENRDDPRRLAAPEAPERGRNLQTRRS